MKNGKVKVQTLKRQEILDRKKKLLKSLSFVFLVAIVLLMLWILLFKNRTYIRKFENDYLKFNYDSTWTLSKNDSESIGFSHKTKSVISINIYGLTSKNVNSNIEEIIDEVKFDIEKQNTSNKLLKEEKTYLTKEKYEAYKMLYEDGNNQILVVVIKNFNNLYVINYTSSNETFDIVIDSFETILNSINIK